ncbi:MAG: hypothetical protein HKO66_16035 [Saprospiraceae bacterium]|nr:hypothetical protein [Bacteroidia bacterium]NNL93753.1 hypothetical protein [Saprospiraceae bacterium]
MSLAQIYCSELSVLDIQNKHTILRFENRIKCLNTVFWQMHNAISNQQKSILVLERKDDLEYINYFLSKFNLKPLSIILDANTEFLSPITINKLNEKIEVELNDINDEKANITFEFLMSELQNYLSNLRTPKLGKLSILDIYERCKLNHIQNASLDIDLFNLIPFDKFKEKKALLLSASNLYKREFKFINGKHLFNTEILLTTSFDSLQILIDDLLEQATEITNELNILEEALDVETNIKIVDSSKSIQTLLHEIKNYKNGTNYSETELIKFDFLINKFCEELKIANNFAGEVNDKIKSAEEAFANFLHLINLKRSSNKKYILKRITKHNSLIDIVPVSKKLSSFSQKLEELNLFAEQESNIGNSPYTYKIFLDAVVEKLELAKYFLETSGEYITWLKFFNQIGRNDRTLINAFINLKGDWIALFESAYLSGFKNSEILKLKDAEVLINEFISCLKDYKQSIVQQIYDIYLPLQKDNLIELNDGNYPKISWQNFFEEYSNALLTRYPIMIMDAQSYEMYIDAITPSIDNTFMLNYIPKKIPNEEWSQNVMTGYSAKYNTNIISRAKQLEDCSIRNYKGIAYNINRSMTHMNSTEINMVSLYLGQSIKKLNPQFRIFQLKGKSIISLMKDDKNAELIQILNEFGAKEIFSNEEDYNLLPAVFADPKSKPLLIVEDGFISHDPEKFNLWQLQLMEQIRISGVQIVSVNNYKLLTNSTYTLSSIITNILSKNNLEEAAVNV